MSRTHSPVLGRDVVPIWCWSGSTWQSHEHRFYKHLGDGVWASPKKKWLNLLWEENVQVCAEQATLKLCLKRNRPLPGGEAVDREPRQREVPRSKKLQLYTLGQGFSTVGNVSQPHEDIGVVWRYFCLSPLIRCYSWRDQGCYWKS
jgi:hypothetical protein